MRFKKIFGGFKKMSTIIDGKKVAQEIKDDLKFFIMAQKLKPCLAVVQVGDNPASNMYVKNKEKACEEVGIETQTIKVDTKITEEELIRIINTLNITSRVNGILLQLPLPKELGIDEHKVMQAIDPIKDVDGFNYVNQGKLQYGMGGFNPCTPAGIMYMLDMYNIDLDGKNVVVLGRSNIVGRPVAEMLLRRNATVTMLHSHSKMIDMTHALYNADIIVSAVGQPKFVRPCMLGYSKPIIIDVGMNRDEDGKLCGDVHPDCYEQTSYYTPVPGGVGPMTIAMLLNNCVQAYISQNNVKLK
jgi:methylenetetrahydrofolate dehydrogenase (NADP+)/methenyltetrahydrofolate cyclohydrolase